MTLTITINERGEVLDRKGKPAGWKVAPVEPTPQMRSCYVTHEPRLFQATVLSVALDDLHRAMLAASPPLPPELAQEAVAWHPIETAPKDGTRVILWMVHPTYAVAIRCGEDGKIWQGSVIGEWIDHNGGGWTWHGMFGSPTHWMPLPAAPQPADKP